MCALRGQRRAEPWEQMDGAVGPGAKRGRSHPKACAVHGHGNTPNPPPHGGHGGPTEGTAALQSLLQGKPHSAGLRFRLNIKLETPKTVIVPCKFLQKGPSGRSRPTFCVLFPCCFWLCRTACSGRSHRHEKPAPQRAAPLTATRESLCAATKTQ